VNNGLPSCQGSRRGRAGLSIQHHRTDTSPACLLNSEERRPRFIIIRID